jgi:WD40 repeat protein/serine/threonine protein kinase
MVTCLTPDQLQEALSAIDNDQYALVEAHLNACPKCQSMAQEYIANNPVPDLALPANDSIPRAPKLKTDALSGQRLGHFLLQEELGRGGKGVVYKALDNSLNRIVALKMILTGQFASEEDVLRFRAEAEAAANLNHPGIVPIFEVGEHDGQHYFSMGFVEGESLAERLTRGPLPPNTTAALVRQIAEAVAYAHECGVIHRDLKPHNILLAEHTGNCGPGIRGNGNGIEVRNDSIPSRLTERIGFFPQITDFGLAKRIAADSGLTVTGQIFGTPSYMSPEQAAGKSELVNSAADIYAIGAILYACLTGRPPFESDSLEATILQVRDMEPVPPRRLNPTVPRDLETICLKCLEKDPNLRYKTARDLAEDLRRFLSGLPVLARPIQWPVRWWRLCRRHYGTSIAASIGTLLLAVLILVWIWWSFDVASINASLQATTESLRVRSSLLTAQRDIARRNLYAANMKEAFAEFDRANVARVRDLLLRYIPANGEEDLRGFEWFYLWRECHQELLTLVAHKQPIHAIALSADGNRCVTGAGSLDAAREKRAGELLLWNLAENTDPVRLVGHADAITCAAFSPDNTIVATGSADRTVRLWDARNGTHLKLLKGHRNEIKSLSFVPDLSQLVSADRTGNIRFWDLPSGEQISSIRPAKLGISKLESMALSPDGSRLAIACKQYVTVRLIANHEELARLTSQTDAPAEVVYSPDGRMLATASGETTSITSDGHAVHHPGEIKLWAVSEGGELTEHRTLRGHSAAIIDLVFSPSGRSLVSASRDRTMNVWDPATGTLKATLRGHTDSVNCVAFTADGKRLMSGSSDGTAKFWDFRDAPDDAIWQGKGSPISSLAYSSNGKMLAISTFRHGVSIFDTATQQIVPVLDGNQFDTGQSLDFSPTETLLAVGTNSGLPNKKGDLYLSDGKYVRKIGQHDSGLTAVKFAPNGRWLISADRRGVLKGWELPTGREISVLRPNTGLVYDVCFSLDGKQLALACEDMSVTLVEIRGDGILEQKKRLIGHSKVATCIVFSPDGSSLASGSADGTAILWDIQRGTIVHTIRGNPSGVSSLAFSPDGKTLLLVSDALRFLDPVTGEERVRLSVDTGRGAPSVAFKPNGRSLAIGHWQLQLWQAASPNAVDRVPTRTANIDSLPEQGPALNINDLASPAAQRARVELEQWLDANSAGNSDVTSKLRSLVATALDEAMQKNLNFQASIGSGLTMRGAPALLYLHDEQFFPFELSLEQAKELQLHADTLTTGTYDLGGTSSLSDDPYAKLESLTVGDGSTLDGNQEIKGHVTCNLQATPSSKLFLRLVYRLPDVTSAVTHNIGEPKMGTSVIDFSFPPILSGRMSPAAYRGPLVLFISLCEAEDNRSEMEVVSNTVAVLKSIK